MFEFKNGTVRMYGPVGMDGGFGHSELMRALDKQGGADISIRMSSVGGDVDTGFLLYNALREYPGHVSMRIDTQAYSIASVVMLAGDEITASENAEVMVHNAWTIALGNATEFRQLADLLDRRDMMLADTYARHTSKDREFWLSEMSKETYYSASEAKRVGLIHSVAEASSVAAMHDGPIAVCQKRPAPLLSIQKKRREILQARRRWA